MMIKQLFQLNKIFLLLLILSFSCESPQKETETTEQLSQEKEEIYYESAVDKLRIRSEPNTAAEVVHLLGEGQKVLFLHEKSSQKEKISIRGQEIEEYWFKVSPKAQKEIVGWVFGGALRKVSTSRSLETLKVEQKEVKGLLAAEIGNLFKLDGIRAINEPYSGFYSFYKDENGREVLQGKFQLIGKEHEKQNSEGYSMVSYRGSFVKGKKEGDFGEKARFYEGDRETILVFHLDQCIEKKLVGSAEGEDFEHSYEEFLCTFEYEDYY